MYKNPYFSQMQANFQQQQAQFLAQQQAEYQKQFAAMTDEHKQKFASICTDAQLNATEQELLLADVCKLDSKEVASKLNIDIDTDTGKQIYQSILQSAHGKIVAKYGGMLK